MKTRYVLTAALLAQGALASGAAAQAINDNPLSDPRVRQAIAYAIDMDTIAETIFEGAAIPASGLLPNGPFKPDDLNPYSYDPDKARELLAEADWDQDYVLDVVFYYNDQLTADFMAALQAYFADVGLQMEYRLLEGGDIGAQINTMPEDPVNGPTTMQWDILYGARAALALQEYYNPFGQQQMATVPEVPEMVELVAKVNSTLDPEVQKEAFFALERLNNEKLYQIPLYYQQLYAFDSGRIDRAGNEVGNEQYQYDWGITEWTVEGDSVAYTNGAPSQFFEVPWRNLGIFSGTKLVFDTLLVADAALVPSGGELVESYEVSDDGMTVTLDMRDGATWHDGEPITAEDVVWSLETAAAYPFTHAVVKSAILGLEGAKAFLDGDSDSISGLSIDGDVITMNFAVLQPNLLLALSQFTPFPASYFEGVDPVNLQEQEFWQAPVGSGPYMIEEVQMNDFVTFVPYEDYWGGVANIKQIIATPSYDSDPNLLRNAAAGRADFGYTKSVSDVAGLEAIEGFTIYPVDIPYTRFLNINQFVKE